MVFMSHGFSQSCDMDRLCQGCFGAYHDLKTFESDATTHVLYGILLAILLEILKKSELR